MSTTDTSAIHFPRWDESTSFQDLMNPHNAEADGKTIAQLEAEHAAAEEAFETATTRYGAIEDAIRVLGRAGESVAILDAEDGEGADGELFGIRRRLEAKLPGIKAEIDRLEDVANAAAEALNAAPEEQVA